MLGIAGTAGHVRSRHIGYVRYGCWHIKLPGKVPTTSLSCRKQVASPRTARPFSSSYIPSPPPPPPTAPPGVWKELKIAMSLPFTDVEVIRKGDNQ